MSRTPAAISRLSLALRVLLYIALLATIGYFMAEADRLEDEAEHTV